MNWKNLGEMAKAHIGLKQFESAVEATLAAVSRLYYYPEAHFHLGVAMTRLGWAERAEQVLLVCTKQRPTFALAHRWLARLYSDYLHLPQKAQTHAESYRALGAHTKPDFS